MSVLPTEILDLILEHIHDDTGTMRACAQVCQAWRPRMQRLLFQSISFTVFIREKSRIPPFRETVRVVPDIRPLYKAAKRSPHLLSYVRNFNLKIHGDYWRYKALLNAPSRFLQSRLSKIWYRYLPFILHGLSGVETLIFTNYLMHALLTECPREVHDGLLALLHRPTLKSLHMPFGSAFELFAILSECPQVSNLSLGMVTCGSTFDVALYPRVPALNLETLLVSCGKFLFLRLLQREFPSQDLIKFNRLDRLQIHVSMCYMVGDSSVVEATEQMLLQNKDTLRHLSLNMYLSTSLFELVDLTRLQSVDFKIDSTSSSSDELPAPKQWIEWLIRSFTGVNVAIEECTLQLVQFSVRDDLLKLEDDWHALDAIFASWPSLRQLVVVNKWRGPSFSEPSEPRLCALDMEDVFPVMSASGRLVIA